ncbi:TetR/AcrR family transcriptional regulator [Acinetobacter larvae]|uniref:TetR family transcriptional regulator n=1 Tax=Acinetobacter larvae TaxID=1789224 RepID=A0A1B2M418_9GAMM|nr:TetR/AcrR family transcriptional regulator [Acinetobacter larvae]AOA59914.1 TetR family transcriptional regulator [Acinetobacter larvae]
MKNTSTQKRNAKQKLLDAAANLFYNDGIHPTGINTITAQAGVAKMSLYNNFPTKSDLIAAYIEARHQQWLDLYAARLAQAEHAVAKVIAVFEAYQDHAEGDYLKGFRGCGLLNAAAEFPAHSPERQAVRQHKEQVEQILKTHLAALYTDQNQCAQQAQLLSFILEGAIARAGLEGCSDKMLAAKQMVQQQLAQDFPH